MRVAQLWRSSAQRYSLMIDPMTEQDERQNQRGPTAQRLSGKGEVYSFTVIQDPPAGFEEQAPYVLAMIRLDEGPMLTAQLTDLDAPPQIGLRVEMVTRKLRSDGAKGPILYGYKFRPILHPE
jgi:hypothetical protein